LAAVSIIAVLFFLGKTTSDKKIVAPQKETSPSIVDGFDIQKFLQSEKIKLSPTQVEALAKIEENISKNDTSIQQQQILLNTANFWKDSIQCKELYAFYISEISKLDYSEKNLTFAAQIFLDGLRGEDDLAKVEWESAEAISLFEKALALNPENDDLKIALASCYIYGKGRSGDPQETMKGIQQLLSVVRKDSTNMKAQMVLGVGGYVSGQYDKAIARLKKVVTAEPDNFEATAFLADTYAAQGNKEEAIKWYNLSKRLSNNPDYNNEVDNRIKTLQKN
jgi:tetratricopeptide (TPR) repeat protein